MNIFKFEIKVVQYPKINHTGYDLSLAKKKREQEVVGVNWYYSTVIVVLFNLMFQLSIKCVKGMNVQKTKATMFQTNRKDHNVFRNFILINMELVI